MERNVFVSIDVSKPQTLDSNPNENFLCVWCCGLANYGYRSELEIAQSFQGFNYGPPIKKLNWNFLNNLKDLNGLIWICGSVQMEVGERTVFKESFMYVLVLCATI